MWDFHNEEFETEYEVIDVSTFFDILKSLDFKFESEQHINDLTLYYKIKDQSSILNLS